ncbi:MAG: hypothetical protein QOH20_4557 [Mycobacterium sp.]|jgi:hypothetical protein|nr:hypothetical protein [Mycobacterium sp.]
MTSRQQDWLDVLAMLSVAGRDSRQTGDTPDLGRAKRRGEAPWSVLFRARLFAARYDRQIENGVSPAPGSPLAVHRMRLTSPRERDDLERALRVAVHDADFASHFNARVPVRSVAVHDCAEVIDAVCDRLADPFPVRPRGMARLRILLSDGRGPLYWPGRGTLNAELRGVLATL